MFIVRQLFIFQHLLTMKIRRLDYDAPESQQHEREGLPLLEVEVTHEQHFKTFIKTFAILFGVMSVVIGIVFLIAPDSHALQEGFLSNAFWIAFAEI